MLHPSLFHIEPGQATTHILVFQIHCQQLLDHQIPPEMALRGSFDSRKYWATAAVGRHNELDTSTLNLASTPR